jgi:thiol-disulfide isomerase/thioredoxin
MKDFNNYNVSYLTNEDVINNNKLKPYVTRGKKTVVMVQSDNCGHCTKAKPEFAKLSEDNNITCATIKLDGEENERSLMELVKECHPSYRGVPVYIIFNSDGSLSNVHNGGRSKEEIMESLM